MSPESTTETSNTLVVMCGNTPYDANPLGARPLAESLSRQALVLYVDPPLSFLTTIKQPQLRKYLRAPKFEMVSPTLYRLIPFVAPGKDRPFINRMTSLILKRKIKKAVAEIKRHHEVAHTSIIATAPHYRIFNKNYSNIYWMMDDYASQPELTGIDQNVLRKGQQYLSKKSQHIITVSKQLAVTQDNYHEKCSIIPNGVDIDTFMQYPFDTERAHLLFEEIPPRFALYVGGLNNRVSLEYLDALADASIPLVIAGNQDPFWDDSQKTYFEKMCDKEYVYYLGNVSYTDIPSLMFAADVGLVPYAAGKFNEASMPLKIPEYLSTGLTVVSTALGFSSAFSEDDLTVSHDVEEFVHDVKTAMSSVPTPGQRAMRSARIAQEWSWDTKARQILELI